MIYFNAMSSELAIRGSLFGNEHDCSCSLRSWGRVGFWIFPTLEVSSTNPPLGISIEVTSQC